MRVDNGHGGDGQHLRMMPPDELLARAFQRREITHLTVGLGRLSQYQLEGRVDSERMCVVKPSTKRIIRKRRRRQRRCQDLVAGQDFERSKLLGHLFQQRERNTQPSGDVVVPL